MDLTQRLPLVRERHRRIRELLDGQRIVLCLGQRGQLLLHASTEGPELVGACTTEDEAVALVERLRPQLLITHDELEEGDGLSLTRRARALLPSLRVLLLVRRPQRLDREAAMAAGCTALCDARRLGGGSVILALQCLLQRDQFVEGSLRRGAPRPPRLSPREQQVLQGLDQGLSNSELAADLGLRPHTVKGYVRQVQEKLGARNRTEAVALAFQTGLLQAD
ncbi:MAG: response regulator transcription factor [Cyanobacteriota bacterium]